MTRRQAACTLALLAVLTALTACSTFRPTPDPGLTFTERAQTKAEGRIRVTVAVPSAEETEAYFGVPLYDEGIQPIWLEVENSTEEAYWFLPYGVDPMYYSPLEAAWKSHFAFSGKANRAMDEYFYGQQMPLYAPPGITRVGFVYSNLDEGTKQVNIDLLSEGDLRSFTFFVPVPGLRVDHHAVDFERLHSPERIVELDEAGLRAAIEGLPCCTSNAKGTELGDPLNLVMIGSAEDVYHALIRSRWDETEILTGETAAKTLGAFLSGARYRYSPVSALYYDGRPQDVAFQKARATIHERNHLRLWLSTMRFEGKPLWVGQISRDIGVRYTTKSPTFSTHKIDPDIDESREYLVQDLAYTQGLAAFGYVKGVGPATMVEPRHNLTGDPYFTDGLRAALVVSGRPVSLEDVRFFDWERLADARQ